MCYILDSQQTFTVIKKDGLVYDTAPIYCSKVVIQKVKYQNNDLINTITIFVEFVVPCLTSIYYTLDVMFNNPFRALIRSKYND